MVRSGDEDRILPLYEQWGISGIKFGFVQIGSQEWTTWLHRAVRKCADHHIMVDIHDEYRPTGWSRTYPNLMTQEGIGGNEEMPDAKHTTCPMYIKARRNSTSGSIAQRCGTRARLSTAR